VEPLPPRVVQLADRLLLEQQRAVDQTRVDVQEQLRVAGSTPLTRSWTSLIRRAAASASDLEPNVSVYVSSSVRWSRRHGLRS
jgi:hypothetical protein